MTKELGRFHKVELQDYFDEETSDFTSWLSKPENISLLADSIGLDIQIVTQTERSGSPQAEIVARDKQSGKYVLIESQMGQTDDAHLGRVITHAAWFNAIMVVWIAGRFNDEHRKALDWLNQIACASTQFRGIELELWRIGDSLPAPKFSPVLKGGRPTEPNLSDQSPTKPEQPENLGENSIKTELDTLKSLDTRDLNVVPSFDKEEWKRFKEWRKGKG